MTNQTKYEKIKEAMGEGKSLSFGLKHFQLSPGTYYNYRDKDPARLTKKVFKKRSKIFKVPEVIKPQSKMFMVVGTFDELVRLAKELQ